LSPDTMQVRLHLRLIRVLFHGGHDAQHGPAGRHLGGQVVAVGEQLTVVAQPALPVLAGLLQCGPAPVEGGQGVAQG